MVVVVPGRYFSRFLTAHLGRLSVCLFCLHRPHAVLSTVSLLPLPLPLPLLVLVLLREQIAMPFIRPIQKAFFAEQCREMINLVKEEEEG